MLETIFDIILGTLLVLIIVLCIYEIAISPILYKHRLKKAKALYPDFFKLKEECFNLEEEQSLAWRKADKTKAEIEVATKELIYVPFENQSIKKMEIEALKKKYLSLKLDYEDKWSKFIDLNNKLESKIDESKLLVKLYR